MLEIRDPAIKLFGKTIPVIGDGEESPRESNDSSNSDQQIADNRFEKELVEEESMEIEQRDDSSPPTVDESRNSPKAPNSEINSESEKDENELNDTKNSPQKTLKKPDKILPCPRCNSMDTKFCYYNNYNVNQPRHFCKSCQRYWTAGGTMRNVPVGAGRRKHKSSASRYCHMSVSEALQAAQIDLSNGVHHPGLKTNGTVLTFGSDTPLYEYGDDHSSGSTVTTTNSMDDGIKKSTPDQTNQMPCFQWPYIWNPSIPIPAFYPSAYPMSFYPAPFYNGGIPWNISPGSNPNPPTLGKHPRDDGKSFETTTTVLIPKTLRIDNPDEAAMSSIWTTLGIKKGKGDCGSQLGFFNNFRSKGEEKNYKMESSTIMKANPAALCRSISFQESS